MNTLHLNEEQLDDILLGEADPTVLAHCEVCTTCAARVNEMRDAITSFTTLTLAWSERRSATLPAPPMTDGSLWRRKLNWALGAAVLVVGVMVLPLTMRTSSHPPTITASNKAEAAPLETSSVAESSSVDASSTLDEPNSDDASSSVASSDTAAQPAASSAHFACVAADNRMLHAIDAELDASVASPAETFDLDAPQGGS